MLGKTDEQIQDQFGHMLEAFDFGAPPHGGMAPGIDRLIMYLTDDENVREVIAFPKSGGGFDPMMDAPSEVEDKQLRELGLTDQAPAEEGRQEGELTMTVTLEPETENEVRQKAAEHGQEAAIYSQQLIQAALKQPVPQPIYSTLTPEESRRLRQESWNRRPPPFPPLPL